MKKCITLLLAFTLILSMGVSAFAQPNDVGGHWAKNEISYLVEKGVLNGYPDGTFKPDNPMSKVEFYKVINELLNFDKTSVVPYSDVKETDWYHVQVSKALAAGYISPGLSLLPNENITRQEVARIIGLVYNVKAETDVAMVFSDSTLMDDESKGYIGALLLNNVLCGYPDGSFRPTEDITRAEVVKTIYNVLEKKDVLVEKVVIIDKSKLEKAINDVNKLDEDDYTKSSWNSLEAAHDIASSVFNNEEATQSQVDNALNGLKKSINDLKKETKESDKPKTERFTVKFVDWNGSIIDSQRVKRGNDAKAPKDPSRAGYTFIRWDISFRNVTKNLTVNALYEKIAE